MGGCARCVVSHFLQGGEKRHFFMERVDTSRKDYADEHFIRSVPEKRGRNLVIWKEGRNQKSKRRDLKGNWNGTSAFHAGRKFYRDTEYHSGK